MVLYINTKEKCSWFKRCGALLMAAAFIALVISAPSQAETMEQRNFASPEEAVKTLIEALKSNDVKAAEAIFGPGSKDLLWSGDPVADQSGREQFLRLYEQKYRLEATEAKAVLNLGTEDWPFPIPIVKKGGLWYFDTKQGREELLARRIGLNELSAIKACLAYVDAQREYALKDRDGDGLLEYAQKFRSDTGKKNGLYWEVKAGEGQSPLGPLFAAAQEKGYTSKAAGGKPIPYHGYYYRILTGQGKSPLGPLFAAAQEKGYTSKAAGGKPIPYHGYYYRILTGQGKSAPGGAYDYMVKGNMIGGFALVAYPAKYASSGVMTFIVNHDGVVYQKDLGRNTAKAVQAMKLFNPDSTWKKVE